MLPIYWCSPLRIQLFRTSLRINALLHKLFSFADTAAIDVEAHKYHAQRRVSSRHSVIAIAGSHPCILCDQPFVRNATHLGLHGDFLLFQTSAKYGCEVVREILCPYIIQHMAIFGLGCPFGSSAAPNSRAEQKQCLCAARGMGM